MDLSKMIESFLKTPKIKLVGLGLSLVTLLSWLLIVIGFGLLTSPIIFSSSRLGAAFFPHWIISLGGIPLVVLACFNTMVTKPMLSKILRAVTTVASIVFLVCLGMILYSSGSTIVTLGSIRLTSHGANLAFSGALLATLTWSGHMVLWVFYPLQEPAN